MKKLTFENTLEYTFDGTRRGAKYSLDGKKWLNHGEYAEVLAKHVLGYEAKKDANTRFDKGEDIEELNASIKSHNCGLTDMKLGDTKEMFLERFWQMSKENTTYIWVFDHDEEVDLYFMNMDEFKEFVNEFGSWDNHCRKIRIKKTLTKIIPWLEKRV